MPQSWYYKLMGEEVGPLSAAELREHVHEGRLTRDLSVRRADSDRWVLADSIEGLFDPVAKSVTTPVAQPSTDGTTHATKREPKAFTRSSGGSECVPGSSRNSTPRAESSDKPTRLSDERILTGRASSVPSCGPNTQHLPHLSGTGRRRQSLTLGVIGVAFLVSALIAAANEQSVVAGNNEERRKITSRTGVRMEEQEPEHGLAWFLAGSGVISIIAAFVAEAIEGQGQTRSRIG